jgi:mannose-6-phosphate isomerase-like protein (cupin superfamily)
MHGGRDRRVAAACLRHLHGDAGLLTTRPPKVVKLEDIEAIPGPGTLTWRPVRLTLGIEAFGTNAYTAAEAGADVVEPHTESPQLGHQELYYVAEGRAKFILDDEEHEVGPGTYVFVPDTATHRHAIAQEPGTTVLSFGGPPVFKPSAWEWTFRVGKLKKRDPTAARKLLEEGLEAWPESPSIFYELGCWEAEYGDKEKALDWLRRAVEKEPKIREWMQDDDDLASLRGEPLLQQLLNG